MASEFSVKQIAAGFCFSYVLVSDGQAVLVDPHITLIQEYRGHFRAKGLALTAIIDTHTHADHLSGAAILAGEVGCPIVMSDKAVSSLEIRKVGQGDTVSFGSASLDVLAAPGHTDDSIALIGGGCVFTGDVLLIGSVGRTDFQNGSPEDMFDTLATLKLLPAETTVYPAHDYKDNTVSTIGREASGNPFMIETDRAAFAANARSKVLSKPFNMDAIIQTNREGLAREIEYISAAETQKRLAAEGDNWQILDVRRPDEYKAERVDDALHIPLDTLSGRIQEVSGSGKRFVLTCRSGGRASIAASILLAAGVHDVALLEGGMLAWRKAGLPAIREKVPVSLERQVRTIAGSLVLIGCLLALFVNVWFLAIPLFVGSGLVFAGLSNSCMMGMLLMKHPYNKKAIQSGGSAGGSCSLDAGCSMDAGGDTDGGCAM